MASPNPKSTERKKIQGTDRADRTKDNRMNPMKVLNVPEPPDYLGARGKELWNTQLQQLAHLKMLTKVDLTILGQYCKEWDIYREAIQEIDDNGFTNKHDQVSPSISVKDKAFKNMLQIADRFGFAASAREKLSMPEQSKSEDPLEAHLGKKSG